MKRYILSRMLQALIALFVMSALLFVLVRLTGDPIQRMLPVDATEQEIEALRVTLGLDGPLYAQYFSWIAAVAQGDLGTSLVYRRPVAETITTFLPNSIALTSFALLIALALSIPLGVLTAVKKGTIFDSSAKALALMGQSVPSFWLGIVLIMTLSIHVPWLPAGGMEHGLASYILPGSVVGFAMTAGLMRLLRSAVLDVLDSDYVKLARIKGVSESSVIWHHSFRNALIPLVTFAGYYYGLLIGASIVIETVFTWPGIGRLAYQAVLERDFPLIQGIVLVVSASIIIVNLVVDILYAYIDPRIRY